MHCKFRYYFFAFLLCFPLGSHAQWLHCQWRGSAQGTSYNIIIYYNDSSLPLPTVKIGIDHIFYTIDTSLSRYNSTSLLNTFNNPTTTGILMNEHFKHIVLASSSIYKQSNGIFDPTILPLVLFWKDRKRNKLSNKEKVSLTSILSHIGFKHLKIVGDSLIKLHPKVTLDFDGIAQGYTVDMIAAYLNNLGMQNYLIELGGEIVLKGEKKVEGKPFLVGIESLGQLKNDIYNEHISFQQGALTTSSINKRRSGSTSFQHINPFTGYPTKSIIESVSIYAPTCTLADGFDNVLIQMRPAKAIRFLKRNPFLAASFTYYKFKRFKIYRNEKFKQMVLPNENGIK